ncbi:MAG: hypothetical protein HYT94_01840 [Parcubacteria group bacterium]|nr:hypothetical protein [Parcubacteria group bacterium]
MKTVPWRGNRWYDTKVGIQNSLGSLRDLNQLLSQRRAAGYCRKERLNDFLLFGRYWLDSCGNSMKARNGNGKAVPKELMPNLPDVLTMEEFRAYSRPDDCTSYGMGDDIPTTKLQCAYCGKRWHIHNCHDTVVKHTTEAFSLSEFVGQTLGDVKKAYQKKHGAIYVMQRDILIRHDRFIDLSPKYPNPEHDWQKDFVKNEKGWVSERDGITDRYVIKDGDEGFFNVWTYYHSECNRKHMDEKQEREFREIFTKANFTDIQMTSLPNEYCPCEHCPPWFDVETEFGTIKIGWRKRVINIDWANVIPTTVAYRKLTDKLFEDEDVTKGVGYIHAWGYDKAVAYLTRLHDMLVRVS